MVFLEGTEGVKDLVTLLVGLTIMSWFVMLVGFIAIYIIIAKFLNKFNKLVYGKGTAMAWIPGLNVYLLGKLTINKIVGWVLVVLMFLSEILISTNNDIQTSEGVTVIIDGVEQTQTSLPKEIGNILSIIYSLAVIGLLIYAIIKYNKLKKLGTIPQPTQINNQPQQMPEPNQIVDNQPEQTSEPTQIVNNQPEPQMQKPTEQKQLKI